MHVSALTIYPLKSAAGVSLSSSAVGGLGLQWDRRWALVGADGRALTQRQYASMALLSTAIDDAGTLTVTRGGGARISVTSDEDAAADRPRLTVDVWGGITHALGYDARVDEWFSEAVGVACRLAFCPSTTNRGLSPGRGLPSDRVSFADGYPLLVVSEASLTDLNQRLMALGQAPVPMNRFRPNVVIAEAEPYQEDRLLAFHLGPIPCVGIKTCQRCVITTIDQQTLVTSKEPLRTLATYRRTEDGGVLFGWNVVPRGTGRLQVGDPVIPEVLGGMGR